MLMVLALGWLIAVELPPHGVVELSFLVFGQFSLLVGCSAVFGSPSDGLAAWLLGLVVSWFCLSFWLVRFQLVFCWLFVSVSFRGLCSFELMYML